MGRSLVDVHSLAKVLECSARKVQLLVLNGMPRASHGKYDLEACQHWYTRWNETTKRIAKEKANRTLRRDLRRELRSFPLRVAPLLVGKSRAEIRHVLRSAIDEVSARLRSSASRRKQEEETA